MLGGSFLKAVATTAALASSSLALRIPLRREAIPRQGVHTVSTARTAASSASSYDILSGFENLGNYRYVGEVGAFGTTFNVIFDTGSNDLWIVTTGTNMYGYTNSSVFTEIDYGIDGDDSSAKGYVIGTDMTFGDFNLTDSTFISVYSASEGLLESGIDGLMGLGPPTEESNAEANLQAAGSAYDGNSLLQDIFLQYPDVPPQITILMSRNEGSGEVNGGDFTIGDPLPNYPQIVDAPKLPVIDSSIGPHWTIQFDGLVINGKTYSQTGVGSKNFTGVLDSGTPTAYIDSYFWDLIYGSYPNGIPCSTQLNVSFIISGQEFAIHPIDLTDPSSGTVSNATCSPSMVSLPSSPGLFLLGDTFLRNVYTLHNFNHYEKAGDALPYTQLLSVTDATSAAAQFSSLNNQRLQQYFSSSSAADAQSDVADAASSASSAAPTGSPASPDYSELTRNTYIIMGMLVGVLALLVAVAVIALKNGRATRGYKRVGVDLVGHDKPYNPVYSD